MCKFWCHRWCRKSRPMWGKSLASSAGVGSDDVLVGACGPNIGVKRLFVCQNGPTNFTLSSIICDWQAYSIKTVIKCGFRKDRANSDQRLPRGRTKHEGEKFWLPLGHRHNFHPKRKKAGPSASLPRRTLDAMVQASLILSCGHHTLMTFLFPYLPGTCSGPTPGEGPDGG